MARAANDDYFHDWLVKDASQFPRGQSDAFIWLLLPNQQPKTLRLLSLLSWITKKLLPLSTAKSSHCTSWLTFKKPEPANSWHFCFRKMTKTVNSLSELINRMVPKFLSNDQLNSRCISSWKKRKDCIIFPRRQSVHLEFFFGRSIELKCVVDESSQLSGNWQHQAKTSTVLFLRLLKCGDLVLASFYVIVNWLRHHHITVMDTHFWHFPGQTADWYIRRICIFNQ